MIGLWVFLMGMATGIFFEEIAKLIYTLMTQRNRERQIKAENNRKTMEFFCNFKIK